MLQTLIDNCWAIALLMVSAGYAISLPIKAWREEWPL